MRSSGELGWPNRKLEFDKRGRKRYRKRRTGKEK
jgi:hypothetical protein